MGTGSFLSHATKANTPSAGLQIGKVGPWESQMQAAIDGQSRWLCQGGGHRIEGMPAVDHSTSNTQLSNAKNVFATCVIHFVQSLPRGAFRLI